MLELGGARREVVVLFSDLRGFTAYSDTLAPERLVTEVNAYLDRMVEVIREEGGVVDKYIGDAIMVVFGLPESKVDDCLRAARCAARMQEALAEHNADRALLKLPPPHPGHRGAPRARCGRQHRLLGPAAVHRDGRRGEPGQPPGERHQGGGGLCVVE